VLKRDENVSMSMNYAEYIVNARVEGKLLVRRILIALIFLALLAAGTWAVCGGIVYMPPIELLVIGICGVGFYFTNESTRLEYEYIVASAKVEFDTIYGQRRRKEIITVSLDDIERIAPFNSETSAYIKSKKIEKSYDFCSSLKSKRRYFMFGKIEGCNTVIYFDAVSKTLDVLRFFRSNIVEIDKDIYNM